MKKLLLAINHKETEETIKTMVRDDFLCVGTATYKEAVLPLLKDTQPDVLVLRDTLQGNTPILQMIEEIRIEIPDTRIVFISKLRAKTDSLLAALVSYGIYDIINKDIVPVDEMVSHIIHPRNFRDVSLYYTGVEKVEHDPEESMPENTQPKPGFWSSLFGGKAKTETITNPVPFQNPDRQTPAVDAGIIKMLIRRYLKLGTENIPPADISGFLLRYEAPSDVLRRIETEIPKQPAKPEIKPKQQQKLPEPIHTQKKTEQKKRNPLLDLIE